MALLVGNSMSLFKVNFNGFLGSMVGVTNDGSGEVPKIENGLLKRPNYDDKRIYFDVAHFSMHQLWNDKQPGRNFYHHISSMAKSHHHWFEYATRY